MALCGTWRTGLAGLLACAAFAGCGRQEPQGADGANPGVPALQVNSTSTVVQTAKTELRLHQSFADATLADMPEQILPELTKAGKSVGKLYEQVIRRWDQVSFLTAKGEKLIYTAVLDTEIGPIEIEFMPEIAPNHVRNFVVLAQCGYYDGLVFERTVVEQSDEDPKNKVEMIEGGCPMGMGTPGYGSIGYWLQPEFNSDVHHEEGTVGACRWEEPESAACRFYITLSKAPVLDGERTVFGKVTRGLDVVRRISTQPVMNTPDYPLGDRPEKPVTIRKVTVKVRPANAVVAQETKR